MSPSSHHADACDVVGQALGVEVLDHIIVTTGTLLSFKQRELL